MLPKRSFVEWPRAMGHGSEQRIRKLVEDESLGISIKPGSSREIGCTDCPSEKAKHVSHPERERHRKLVEWVTEFI